MVGAQKRERTPWAPEMIHIRLGCARLHYKAIRGILFASPQRLEGVHPVTAENQAQNPAYPV